VSVNENSGDSFSLAQKNAQLQIISKNQRWRWKLVA